MTHYRCKFVFVLIFIISLTFGLASCSRISGKKSSVILIAVENLSAPDFSCNSYHDAEKSAFQILCGEGVRFTHAYVPSVLSQPTMGSILTGIHPIAHGLRDNSSTYLSAKIKTTPEELTERSIKSLFVVSAPTIKRYSRLHQGFEIFDDNLNIQILKPFRPSKEVIQLFKEWHKDDVGGDQFFAVLHFSDLMFPLSETQNNMGESRPLGIESELEEIDESIYDLFNYLKQKNLWDNNYIILTGLNGVTNANRINVSPNSNLYSENANVVLFIKPPKGREETPHNWKIDEIVSLMDLGITIKEIFATKENTNSNAEETEHSQLLVGQSLLPFVLLNKNQITKDRALLIESAWAKWVGIGEIRYSIRKNQWLYIYDDRPKLYNTLIDRTESVSISEKDISVQAFIEDVRQITQFINAEPWKSFDKDLRDALVIVNQYRINNKYQDEDWSADLLRLNKPDNQVGILKYWLTDVLGRSGKWDRLYEFNRAWGDPRITELIAIAKGKGAVDLNDPCLTYFFRGHLNASLKKNCLSKDFLAIAEHLLVDESEKAEAQNAFHSYYQFLRLKKFLAGLDVLQSGSLMGFEGTKNSDHLLIEIILTLPQFKKQITEIKQ